MRQVRWAIATTASLTLVGTMASGAVAQSPSPDAPPWFGGRVEMAEHGLALTVPDGWVALDPTGDVSAQLRVVDESWVDHVVTYPLPASGLVLQLTAGPSVEPAAQVCHVWSESPSFAANAIDSAEKSRRRATAGDADPGEGYAVLDVRTIETAHATATVIDSVVIHLQLAEYIFTRPDEVILLSCIGGGARPGDDWLSIAETLELLPAE